jgi:hypothetical protein
MGFSLNMARSVVLVSLLVLARLYALVFSLTVARSVILVVLLNTARLGILEFLIGQGSLPAHGLLDFAGSTTFARLKVGLIYCQVSRTPASLAFFIVFQTAVLQGGAPAGTGLYISSAISLSLKNIRHLAFQSSADRAANQRNKCAIPAQVACSVSWPYSSFWV